MGVYRKLLILITSVMLATPLAPARAQSGTSAETSEAAPAEKRARAIELFQRSRELYREGRFREAADLLEEAYALDPAPTLLYNLARALESDGDFEGAVEAYRDYIAADPTADDRPAIERRIQNIEAQIREREDLRRKLQEERSKAIEAAPAPGGVTTEAPEAAETSVVPWVVTGIGAAGLVAGGVLGGLAQSKHGQADDAAIQADAVALDDEARGLARGANIAFIAGGVLAAGGLVWGLVDMLGSEAPADPEAVSVTPSIGPGTAGVLVLF